MNNFTYSYPVKVCFGDGVAKDSLKAELQKYGKNILFAYGTESYGEKAYPKPAAVIMQYTGLTEVTGNEPPTYNCVGTSDGIASWRTMQNRINAIKANGTDTMIEIFDGLPHGFGIGTGTVAEGWLDNATAFWERNMI